MSGTKIAMPHPNSFQSGALSFMSCTSGRESSPLDENDSHQTTEFKSETKKKRFHPLRNLRRMFRRKTRRSSISAESYQPGVLENPEINPSNLEQRSCSTSRLQEENLTQNLIRNSRLNPGLSLSHDSIFTPDRADSGLSSSDLENSSLSITVLTSPSKECPIKSQSSCSETSLLSIGSSEVELSPVRSGKISDLDLGVTAYKLSHSAAKHKMAVKPRRNHGAPRSRRRIATAIASKSPLPTTLEVSEEGATGRSSPPLDPSTSTPETPEPRCDTCDKRPQETKTSWSDLGMESRAKDMEERSHDVVKGEDESDAKDEEAVTQRSESFFGRFLSRRSDKKKKLLQETTEESAADDKPHFVKKLSKGDRKSPNRRQRMEPVEIPTTSPSNKIERKENDEFVGKKGSGSVSPPRSYWPSQVTSRSMSPPKVIWPEGLAHIQPGEPTQAAPDTAKPDISPGRQPNENVLKDWKNPNFVKELTDSISFFARDKSGKREKEDEDDDEEEEENVLKMRRQHSDEVSPRKTSVSGDSILKNKSNSSESVKSSEADIAPLDSVVTPPVEPICISVKTPNVYVPLSFENIHDGYENVQIIEQVKQEVRNAGEAQPVVVETKPPTSPEREKPVKAEVKEAEIQSPPEPEVVRRVKPAVSEKPKDLKRTALPEVVKVNADAAEPKSPQENVSKCRSTLIERRKSELMLLTETEEKEWKAKIKPLKKQTSFSETSKEKGSEEVIQGSPPPKEKEKEISDEKAESPPEITETVVVLRKKSVANTSDDQPELMKVFARRSLKVRESEKIAEEMQRSRDSDKENEIVESPKEDRKKAGPFEREEKETENLISKEGTRALAKGKTTEVKVNVTTSKPEISSRKTVFQRYGRSLSENNAKTREEVEFKRDSSILEESSLNKIRHSSEKTGKEEKEGREEREEEQTGFKRIQQRKAEWERRAQQGAK